MAEEVFDPWFVISIVVAFLAGLLSLFVFFWLRTISREASLKGKSGEMTGIERLDQYERQMIDMKIRLDALEMVDGDNKSRVEESAPPGLLTGLARLLTQVPEEISHVEKSNDGSDSDNTRDIDVISGKTRGLVKVKKQDSTPKIIPATYSNPIDHVLHLITNNITTSRDIQITMKKSREHTSRLLKKMYEDGYLLRNEKNRPYTYSITPKGSERLERNQDKD